MNFNFIPLTKRWIDIEFWIDNLGTPDRKNKINYAQADITDGVLRFGGRLMDFNGSSSFVPVGNNAGEIKSVLMWINPSSSDEPLIELNGSASISIVGGLVTPTGWTAPTIITNGFEDATVAIGAFNLIAVSSDTPITASAVNVGRVGASF